MATAFTKQLVIALPLLLAAIPCAGQANTPSIEEIVRRSAQATQQDWQRAPKFDYCELDQAGKEHRTYQVSMIEGSPYSRLVAVNGQALPTQAWDAEAKKQAAEALGRKNETADQHRKRVAQYERERKQNELLLGDFADAMNFSLAGSATIDKHDTYVLDAKPKPSYVPKTAETKVLTGMKGTLWVDHESFRWAKAQAEAFRPVSIEGFLARVEPGTRFELEEEPVGDAAGTWLMSHLVVNAHARILFVFSKSSIEDSVYFNYKPNGTLPAEACAHQSPASSK